ncbi:hypothetical protein [uncultured Paludibaculum sp.]|uniref:hypothetical protein n=1 Tax=uncultured Paludibaculum sp. TaxID=1765020 RepID=UPI002AAC373C|nr:hypothetical protein [uncultured Paludibaculum sp.]
MMTYSAGGRFMLWMLACSGLLLLCVWVACFIPYWAAHYESLALLLRLMIFLVSTTIALTALNKTNKRRRSRFYLAWASAMMIAALFLNAGITVPDAVNQRVSREKTRLLQEALSRELRGLANPLNREIRCDIGLWASGSQTNLADLAQSARALGFRKGKQAFGVVQLSTLDTGLPAQRALGEFLADASFTIHVCADPSCTMNPQWDKSAEPAPPSDLWGSIEFASDQEKAMVSSDPLRYFLRLGEHVGVLYGLAQDRFDVTLRSSAVSFHRLSDKIKSSDELTGALIRFSGMSASQFLYNFHSISFSRGDGRRIQVVNPHPVVVHVTRLGRPEQMEMIEGYFAKEWI